MKVLLLNFEFPPIGGGGSNACFNIMKELSKKNVEVDVVTSHYKHKTEIEKLGKSVRVHRLNIKKKDLHFWTMPEMIRFSFAHLFYVGKLIRKNHYDLCHVFFTVPSGGIAFFYKLVTLLMRKKLPYLVSIRGSDVPGFDSKRFFMFYVTLKPVVRFIWSNAAEVVSNSEGLKKLAHKTNPKQKISVIYNGINIREFRPGKKRKHIQVLCVARLIERKGINYLIQAVKDASWIYPDIRLVLIGDGVLKKELKTLARKLKVPVEFKGELPHQKVARYYSESHILVLASKNEGMSNTVLEAMASGLPIITTDTGGTRELIKGNGIIVPKEDSDAIAKAIIKLIKHPKLRQEMGRKSREIAEKMDWSIIAEQYLKVYKRVGKK